MSAWNDFLRAEAGKECIDVVKFFLKFGGVTTVVLTSIVLLEPESCFS